MDLQELTIKEIKEEVKNAEVNQELINTLMNDSRVGVRNIGKKLKRQLAREQEKITRWEEMKAHESALRKQGYQIIAGLDEAGRGPLAGPVVAAAVILDPEEKIIGLDDSKKIREDERELLFEEIKQKSLGIGFGIVDNRTIDKLNILQATLTAMKEAVEKLEKRPDYLLIDGNRKIPRLNIKQKTVIDGDSKVNCIAAASIMAKVTRDRILKKVHTQFPQYGFLRNKGYGTSEHIEALKVYGPSPYHRYSFSIVSKYHFLKYKKNLLAVSNEKELREIGEEIKNSSTFSRENLKKLREIYRKQFKKIAVVND